MSETVKISLVAASQSKTSSTDETNNRLILTRGENLLPALLNYLNQKIEGSFSPCAGGGKCGRCRVRFLSNAPLPTPTERATLAPEELRDGIRLACLTKPVKDCAIDILALQEQVERNGNYEIATQCTLPLPKPANEQRDDEEGSKPYILAIDLGTTTIATALYEKEGGKLLAYAAAMNPQRTYGADVVSRMQMAMQDKKSARSLQSCVQEQIRKLVNQTLEQAVRDNPLHETLCGESLHARVQLVLAGNTTMVHLFLGLPVDTLAKAPFTPVTLAPEPVDFEGMPMEIVPGISAFVGGDITAGILACGLLENTGSHVLFLDLGTNAEMVYRSPEGQLTATAAAAGSAFEGQSEKCLYGSGAVHELAELLREGKLDQTGAYLDGEGQAGISQKEIRNLQLAKAAVRAGMELLTGGKVPDTIFLAGGFGRKLHVKDAVAIGLFPAGTQDHLQAVGNTALFGAYLYGCIRNPAQLKAKLAMVSACNLAKEPAFQALFLKYCDF